MSEWRLFVDDERVGPQDIKWTFAPNYEKATKLIENLGIPVDMSLDHDIWTGLMQGGEFVEWLEQQIKNGKSLPHDFEYSIHSSNRQGSAFMQEVMKRITNKEAKHLKQWW